MFGRLAVALQEAALKARMFLLHALESTPKPWTGGQTMIGCACACDLPNTTRICARSSSWHSPTRLVISRSQIAALATKLVLVDGSKSTFGSTWFDGPKLTCVGCGIAGPTSDHKHVVASDHSIVAGYCPVCCFQCFSADHEIIQ